VAELCVNERVERSTAIEVNKVAERSSIAFGNLTFLDKVSETELKGVLSVVLPHSAEVRLLRDEALVLVRVDHILLGDQLGDKLASSFPLLLELLTTLSSGSVNTEDKLVFLISVGE
jgi:hypothetical protein